MENLDNIEDAQYYKDEFLEDSTHSEEDELLSMGPDLQDESTRVEDSILIQQEGGEIGNTNLKERSTAQNDSAPLLDVSYFGNSTKP